MSPTCTFGSSANTDEAGFVTCEAISHHRDLLASVSWSWCWSVGVTVYVYGLHTWLLRRPVSPQPGRLDRLCVAASPDWLCCLLVCLWSSSRAMSLPLVSSIIIWLMSLWSLLILSHFFSAVVKPRSADFQFLYWIRLLWWIIYLSGFFFPVLSLCTALSSFRGNERVSGYHINSLSCPSVVAPTSVRPIWHWESAQSRMSIGSIIQLISEARSLVKRYWVNLL